MAKLSHLKKMYLDEKASLVKYSHYLTESVLYPSNIAKQKVILAINLFNDHNSTALKHIASKNSAFYEGYNDTCTFLEIIYEWWKVINVKSPFKYIRLKDEIQGPIYNQTCPQFQFLLKFTEWVKFWKSIANRFSGLSYETFISLIITCESFLEKYKFSYILLGKFQNVY